VTAGAWKKVAKTASSHSGGNSLLRRRRARLSDQPGEQGKTSDVAAKARDLRDFEKQSAYFIARRNEREGAYEESKVSFGSQRPRT